MFAFLAYLKTRKVERKLDIATRAPTYPAPDYRYRRRMSVGEYLKTLIVLVIVGYLIVRLGIDIATHIGGNRP